MLVCKPIPYGWNGLKSEDSSAESAYEDLATEPVRASGEYRLEALELICLRS